MRKSALGLPDWPDCLAGPVSFAPRFVNVEEHFAGHSVECGHDPRLRYHPGEFFRARRGMRDDEFGAIPFERCRGVPTEEVLSFQEFRMRIPVWEQILASNRLLALVA